MIQETHEQQQIYNLFRSCIYIFLILELIVNMPIGIDSGIMRGFIAILGKLEVFTHLCHHHLCRYDGTEKSGL